MATPKEWLTNPIMGVPKESFDAGGAPGGPNVAIPEVQFQIKVPVVKTDIGYVTGSGSVAYAVTYKSAEEGDSALATKFKNGQPEIEAALKSKYGKAATLGGGGTLSGTEGSVGASLDIQDSATAPKTTLSFKIVKVDATKAEFDFAVLEWDQTYPLKTGIIVIKGMKIQYDGSILVHVDFSPNKEKIAIELAKRFGVSAAENAAAGGTGTAGATAVAAASSPLVIVTSAVVGGVALTAGVCAGIGKLEDLGADCSAVCSEGARQLRAYAQSYGSTMRGNPGSNSQGNQDAEADLQAMMKQAPGTTHDQAVDAAKQSGKKFEDIAYRKLLPIMRDKVTATYKAKEGTLGWFFSSDTFEIVLNEFLDVNSHY